MPPRLRKILKWAGVLVLALLAVGIYYGYRLTLIGSAYHAKMLCSGVFVSGREPAAVEQQDIGKPHPVLELIRARIDRDKRSVSAGMFGLAQREAVFRDGLGCTLAIGKSADTLRAEAPVVTAVRPAPSARPWPVGEAVDLQRLPRGIDAAALRTAIDAAFAESDPALPRRTRAVVIVHDGRIVAERYAEGFGAATAHIGWSMSKTVTSALVGVLVRDGKLKPEQPAPVPEWRRPGDPRSAITLDQLLRMTSGLEFAENYAAPLGDAVFMLFGSGDAAGYAAAKPLTTTPGSTWRYSTGTTAIVSRIVRDTAGDSPPQQLTFPRRALFDRLGMNSAVLEVDASGTYAGASFMYASARDWARVGLLYWRDGVWFGERLLPPGWVKYSATPASSSPGDFGAHLWLRVPSPYFRTSGERPTLPPGTFHLTGHYGQFVSVIPSHKLVIVRLGLSADGAWDHEEFLVQLLKAVPRSVTNN